MKKLLNLSLIGSLGIAIATSLGFNQPILAQNNKYFCAQLHGEYRTFMRTNTRDIPLITWVYTYGNYTPRSRCIEVSRRFERQQDNSSLNQIVTGVIHNQGVLCGVRSQNETCNSNNVLVTLPPNTSPSQRYQYARQLLDTRALASGQTLRLNETPLETFNNGENYYDMNAVEELLEIQYQNQFIDQNITPIE